MQRIVKSPNRRIARLLVIGISVIIVATLLALAFVPSLRETRAARAIRFWQEPPPPEPAVQPGELGKEVQKAETANPSGTVTIDPNTSAALGLQTAAVETKAFD